MAFDNHDRPKPLDQELAASLDLIPEEWLLPPASPAELSELDQAFGCKLPQALIELYKHHGGQRDDIYMLPRRLMPPAEVLETLKKFAENKTYAEDRIWDDGQRTGLFWASSDAIDAAGIFLDGPLAGKIYLRDKYESIEPRPDFRGLGSFYRWLTRDLRVEAGEMAEFYETDYPSLSPSTDGQADRELSKRLFQQWEDGGRRDERLAGYAIRLSAYEDTGGLIPLLLSIALQPDHFSLLLDIVDIILKRNYVEAAERLYQAALNPETRAAATKSLMELLNMPEARRARNKLREMFG